MKKQLLLIFFLCVCIKLLGQGGTTIWVTGYNCGVPDPLCGGLTIDFISGIPQVLNSPRSLSFRRTCATMSDTAGNLLFYTNGFTVCNAQNKKMPNGDSLNMSSAALSGWYGDGMPTPQGVVVIPYPSNPDSFYIFHETQYNVTWPNFNTYAPLELYYSIIDMTQDSGRGDIVEKEITLLQDTLQNGRLTACKHANGRDWWIVTRKAYSDQFYTFLVSPSGISAPLIQNIGQQLYPPDIGQVCFSPQGSKYALVDHFNHLRLYDFDRCTGVFSNPIYIPILDSAIARGVAFSPSGRYLYVSSELYIYQYDMLATSIDSSRQTVAVWDSFYSPSPPFAAVFYTMQLGPDGKIYLVSPNSVLTMHVINSPDSAGIACDVCQHCITLPTFNAYTIPNHPNYFLEAEAGSVCDSLHVGIGEVDEEKPIKIYPNPTTAYFWLDYDLTHSTINGELVVYNTLGELVLRQTLYKYYKSAKVDCNKLKQGIYYLSVNGNNQIISGGKLIKQ